MTRLETLLSLIERQSTVKEFSKFLRSHGSPGGATWPHLLERATHAVRLKNISEAELIEFLSEAEEYGHQHVFLYRHKGAGSIVVSKKVENWLAKHNASNALHTPEIVDEPDESTIVAVRRDPAKNGQVLVIKVVETRIYDRLLGTKELGATRFVREYERERVRAVNIVRVHSDGLVEMRIYSHKNGSADYRREKHALWALMSDLINPTEASPVALVKAKLELYESRHTLEGVVAFSSTILRNSAGVNVTAACGRERNLFSDSATDAGLATMTSEGEAYYDEHNVWWLKQKRGRPTEDIHVRLAGDLNEFAIPQQCSRADYEHVLAEIRKLNR